MSLEMARMVVPNPKRNHIKKKNNQIKAPIPMVTEFVPRGWLKKVWAESTQISVNHMIFARTKLEQ